MNPRYAHMTPAQAAYTVWFKTVGADAPEWENLLDNTRQAWEKAVAVAIEISDRERQLEE